MGWGLAGTGNSSAAVVVAVVAPGGGSKWKSQNRAGFLENRMKSNGKTLTSAKNEKIGISAVASLLKS